MPKYLAASTSKKRVVEAEVKTEVQKKKNKQQLPGRGIRKSRILNSSVIGRKGLGSKDLNPFSFNFRQYI